jgi:hypothetical protein
MFGHTNDNQQQQDQTQYSPEPHTVAPPAADPAPATAPEPNFGLPTVAPSDPTASTTTNTDTSAPVVSPTPAAAPAAPAAPVDSDDLLGLKQEALHQLSPLVGHLDQTPEEKFRTTMMMIQATDDHTKIKDAYEAAQAITDDKVRAQALLDVVNEINYFTQQNQQDTDKAA